MKSFTPMMQQYLEIKEKYSDAILFFRLGDFYEMFFEDAKLVSRELELTLTGKSCGLEERVPMCGVPFHSSSSYIARLINNGHKVAVCEQVEDPSLAKGLVKREVVRIVTPGTVTDTEMLDDKKNNYLVSIIKQGKEFGIAYIDISTGEFCSTIIVDGESGLINEMAKIKPSEIIASEKQKDESIFKDIRKIFNVFVSFVCDKDFTEEISGVGHIKISKELMENKLSIKASTALLRYVSNTQKSAISHIESIKWYFVCDYMSLDYTAIKNLELTKTIRGGNRKGTLIWVLDKTKTSMGARKLQNWMERPLVNVDSINNRLDAVGELKDKFIERNKIMELLQKVYDIERLAGKLSIGNANSRDLISLKNSFNQLPKIKEILRDLKSNMISNISENIDKLEDVVNLIESSIADEPPVTIKDGGIIKDGFNKQVDKLRKATKDGKKWIATFEGKEREATGIKNLKIGFNKIFGYYIEVTKSNYKLVPETYVRKQTLANCERYITKDLKDIEDTILGAEDKLIDLEYNLFLEIRDNVASEIKRIKRTSENIAILDVLCSFAEVAQRMNYVKPEMSKDGILDIKDGRHPVVEKVIDENSFVPNDTYLDTDDNRLSVITGPNMAGKSTYMRQVALIVLMAQMGSFVSAREAKIGVVDKIFTRIGASDDLALGQSTFMVEMNEVANIIDNATKNSLIILDEIGRGTSTYDGLSIAWSVVEHIANKSKIGARTLFATHYHELTELEGKVDGVKNYCITVEKNGEDIIFLRKIVRGGADESYGICVAKLSGIPDSIIKRAKDILKNLETEEVKRIQRKLKIPVIEGQVDLFSINRKENKIEQDIINELKVMDVMGLTPVDALNLIYKLQQKANQCN